MKQSYSIVVCSLNYNVTRILDVVKLHVESLCNQDNKDLLLVFIDNGSSDNTTHILKQLLTDIGCKNYMLLKLSRNFGVAAGYNICYEKAKRFNPRAIVVVNNDVILGKDAIRSLVKFLTGRIGSVQGTLFLRDTNLIDSTGYIMSVFGDYYKLCHQRSLDNCKLATTVKAVTYTHAAFSIYSVDALKHSGDTLYFPYFFLFGDDYEAGLRLWYAGYASIYVPVFAGYHVGSATISSNPELHHDYRYWSLVSHLTIKLLYFLRICAFCVLLSLSFIVLRSVVERDRMILRGLLHSIVLARTLHKRLPHSTNGFPPLIKAHVKSIVVRGIRWLLWKRNY